VSEAAKNYELEIFKLIVNKYLDESTSCTEKSLHELEIKQDQIAWDLASEIYKQSGHKVEFSLVRDIVNSRISSIKYQLAEEARRIAEQKAEEARRIAGQKAEAEEARCIVESDPQFRSKVADVLGKFEGDECKAKVFVRVRELISEQLSVEESEVSLDSNLINHLNADNLDLIELVMKLEEVYEIDISNEVDEDFLGLATVSFFIGFSGTSPSSSPCSVDYVAPERCIVKNFVELICEKLK
jgi:acyl carrier protein